MSELFCTFLPKLKYFMARKLFTPKKRIIMLFKESHAETNGKTPCKLACKGVLLFGAIGRTPVSDNLPPADYRLAWQKAVIFLKS